mmetsp:Transcript_4855/g.15983  ORF Transcript_4855/g.15983 Transcript_4855/m.15983 type:complete len:426 (+) Transcript_4855:94-1371(+)
MEPPRPAGYPPLSAGIAPPAGGGLGCVAVPRGMPPLPSAGFGGANGGGGAVGSSASPLPAGPAKSGLFTIIREDEGWDDGDNTEDEIEEEIDLEGTIKMFASSSKTIQTPRPLAPRRGPSGNLAGLQLDDGLDEQLLMTGSWADMTMSSPDAVRGALKKWVRGETIGRGAMGVVFQAMDRTSGQVIAVKEVAIDQNNKDDLKYKEQLENEIRICKCLDHPRIVKYLGDDYIDGSLYIYLEYMPGGSMSDVLKQFGAFEESLMAVYARELLEGLEYLHTREPPVVHRDVKSANVLVGLDARAKLSDFGCSKRQMETMSHTIKGSIPWMAPEVIVNTGYGRKADIWSFGCVMIEMATASGPWGKKFDNPMTAMMKIGMSKETPPVPEILSEPCKEFIKLCIQRDKELRPAAADLLNHEFVSDLLTED